MTTEKIELFKSYCISQHDIECSQRYGDNLPYSFHLGLVAKQAIKWNYLLDKIDGESVINKIDGELVIMGAWGHDLIEDARNTYNDVIKHSSIEVADIIYCVTDSLGRNREERKNEEFWIRLNSNELAVFVKLCDVIANVTYSLLTTSSMYGKYKKEFPKFKELAYREQYKPMFDHLEKLLSL